MRRLMFTVDVHDDENVPELGAAFDVVRDDIHWAGKLTGVSTEPTVTLLLDAEEASTVSEALDSHLYWQVNDDHSRRDSGYIQEPYTEDEKYVVDLLDEVDRQIRFQSEDE